MAKATFFCLGWIARTYPDMIKRISDRGHEIACHTDKHLFVKEMTPVDFREDLRRALYSIEDIVGEKIISFRAPSFTITEDSKWAFEILAEFGIENDCSIFPISRSYGGFPSFGEAKPNIISYNDIYIKELRVKYSARILFIVAEGILDYFLIGLLNVYLPKRAMP